MKAISILKSHVSRCSDFSIICKLVLSPVLFSMANTKGNSEYTQEVSLTGHCSHSWARTLQLRLEIIPDLTRSVPS